MTTNNDLVQKRTHWEFITLGCMFIGYMAFILSKTVLAVASPEMVKTWGWQSMIQLFLVIAVVATLITIWFAFEDYRRFKPTSGKVSV